MVPFKFINGVLYPSSSPSLSSILSSLEYVMFYLRNTGKIPKAKYFNSQQTVFTQSILYSHRPGNINRKALPVIPAELFFIFFFHPTSDFGLQSSDFYIHMPGFGYPIQLVLKYSSLECFPKTENIVSQNSLEIF